MKIGNVEKKIVGKLVEKWIYHTFFFVFYNKHWNWYLFFLLQIHES